VIDDASRHAVLALAAPGERFAVFASRPQTYRALLAEGSEGHVSALDGAPGPASGYALAIVEGLDDIDDPVGALRAIAGAGNGARVAALIANAAFAPALDGFIAGAVLAGAHAFTAGELPRLFADAGLETLSLASIYGGGIANPAFPLDVATGHVKFRVENAEVLDRMQIAAYLVIARAP
jgi:hypothetical protein